MLWFNLNLKNCRRRQCCHGTSSMKGHVSGVSTQLLLEVPMPFYPLLWSLPKFSLPNTICSIRVLKDALDTTFKLSTYSSKQNAAYKQIKTQVAPSDHGFRTFCPTRWTVKTDSYKCFIQLYCVAIQLGHLD